MAVWRARIPFYYGWVVVASTFTSLAVGYGVYYSFSVFFVALVNEFGWGRASTSSAFSLFLVAMSTGGIAAGLLVDRLGHARTISIGGVMLTVGLFLASSVGQLWQFHLVFGVVCGLGLALIGWVPAVAVVSQWFEVRRATALGVASAGIGLGIVAIVPLMQYVISSLGWRTAYQILAALALIGTLPSTPT